MDVKTSTATSHEDEVKRVPDFVFTTSGSESLAIEVKSEKKVTRVENLYPDISVDSRLGTILSLLDRSLNSIQQAKDELKDGNEVYSDVYVMEFQSHLNELFCNRTSNDGFGMIINSLISAFENLNGTFLNISQITAIQRTLMLLRGKPYLSDDEAIEYTQHLEEAGLFVEPVGFENLVNILTNEEFR